MAVEKGQRSVLVGHNRELDVLDFGSKLGGWVTPDLLARWLWPEHKNADAYARQTITKMVKKDFLLSRQLDSHRHAFVILERGAEFAIERGRAGKVGTRWGRLDRGKPWQAPLSFRHDERAARFLIAMRDHGWAVAFDYESRIANSDALKHPDGLCYCDDGQDTAWVEVEATRKDGADMRLLAQQIIDVAHKDASSVRTTDGRRKKPTQMKLVLPALTKDKAGNVVNHRKRILSAIKRNLQDGDRKVPFWIYQEGPEGVFKGEVLVIASGGAQPDEDDTDTAEMLQITELSFEL